MTSKKNVEKGNQKRSVKKESQGGHSWKSLIRNHPTNANMENRH